MSSRPSARRATRCGPQIFSNSVRGISVRFSVTVGRHLGRVEPARQGFATVRSHEVSSIQPGDLRVQAQELGNGEWIAPAKAAFGGDRKVTRKTARGGE